MPVTAIINTDDCPQRLQPIAKKWAKAASGSLELLQTEGMTQDDASVLIDIALQSVAAMLAPGCLDPEAVEILVDRFRQTLADVSAQFAEDQAAAMVTRQ